MNYSTKILFAALILMGVFSCKTESETKEEISPELSKAISGYDEPFRPQFHFSPPEKWMNDPNGLVHHQGVYHLFYQYYPDDIVWGPMHWGHATSTDMIHWENKPIALYPDEHGLIFSGSAVVDKNNTSGFGTKDNPPLVAIFTYHLMEGEKAGRKDFQTQGIAYSLDNGETWTKYEGNPVIGNQGIKDFRDPKVFWHDESSKWIMALVAGDHAKFYSSDNLKKWVLLSEFGKDKGAHGGVWECPDLFKIPVEGSEEEKWVLLISINPGAPNGGSGTQYFVGDFDGTNFTTEQAETRWLDYGMDNYAGVTYNNVPDGRRVFIGWMSNWNYARDTPTEVWRSSMTLPRKLTLHKNDEGYFLKNFPLTEFDKISKGKLLFPKPVRLDEPFEREYDNLNNSELKFLADPNENYAITYSNKEGEQLCFQLLGESSELLLDRTRSGIVDFEESFGRAIQKQPFWPEGDKTKVRIILDASSVEIFIDEGKHVFTNQIFPKQPYTKLEISGPADGSLEYLMLREVNSIWNPVN
ncbi:glycoside hydrolase family 32 protein [Aureitalea sp. L0-47]|uniref:glycoside hydrolase family 32 protein n=1 Tax=Aureitalea sp. L0-47 TaxID=2816962 RepID=UPI002AA29CA6|nr:glycoside hydrolase family 32 protein [Aureitalea sp. L0-47]